jgi:N-acetylglucosaminyl-diphospho-decaprenol L-rhamnosyltransferase
VATPSVTAILVTHFSARVISQCLKNLPPGLPVVVTDNASTDETRALIRATLPHAVLNENAVGVGFGNAANQGFARADTDFVLLLNPDATLRPDTLDRLLAAAARYPDAGVLAPALRDPDGGWEVSHDVGLFRRLDLPRRRTDAEPTGDICAEYVSGAAMLIRRDALRKVGGFDPEIFLYYEDDDFCLRLRQAGFSLVRVADAVVDHIGGGSIPRTWDKHFEKHRHMAWSRRYIEAKWHGRAAARRGAWPALLRYALKAPGYLLVDFRNKGLRDAARFAGTLAWLMGRRAR